MTTYRWTEIVLAAVCVTFGLAIWWPGDLEPRAAAFVGLVEVLPRWTWGLLFGGGGLFLWLSSAWGMGQNGSFWRRQVKAMLATLWLLGAYSFAFHGSRILGVMLYLVMALLLGGHFLLTPRGQD